MQTGLDISAKSCCGGGEDGVDEARRAYRCKSTPILELIMRRKRAAVNCGNCSKRKPTESVTIRVYRRRKQTDFMCRLCEDCVSVFEVMAESASDGVTYGVFDHLAGRLTEQQA